MCDATHINIGEPWFSAIQKGIKTVEGRLFAGKFTNLQKGSHLVIHRQPSLPYASTINAVVVDLSIYKSFRQMLEQEGLLNTLPGIQKISDGVGIYHQFYTKEKEKENGVAAVKIRIQK